MSAIQLSASTSRRLMSAIGTVSSKRFSTRYLDVLRGTYLSAL